MFIIILLAIIAAVVLIKIFGPIISFLILPIVGAGLVAYNFPGNPTAVAAVFWALVVLSAASKFALWFNNNIAKKG